MELISPHSSFSCAIQTNLKLLSRIGRLTDGWTDRQTLYIVLVIQYTLELFLSIF